jgi:branched-chain amino acid transport system permease protein
MADLAQHLFFGLALGCTYALVALGFTIVYKSSGVINFAQGELLLVGAYIVSASVFEYHLNFFLALLIALLGTIAIGVLFERFVLRRMIGRPVFSILMITIGLDILLRTLVTVRIGARYVVPAPAPFDIYGGVNVGGVHFGTPQLVTIGLTALCCLGLFLFFRYTKYGLAMRATALDQEAALATGLNVRLVYALAWGIAAALATLGGVLLPLENGAGSFDITLGAIALAAFPAIILGGLDSIPGAVVGGILIGITQQFFNRYDDFFAPTLGPGVYAVAPYVLMILVLLIRPYGLFGTRKVERV